MLGVIAVLGAVAGAWGGQWIAAKRDDRRWEREAAREDVRWQREQERLSLQRMHELRLHWREERKNTYGTFLSRFDAWYDRMKKDDSLQDWSYWTRERMVEVHELVEKWRDSYSSLELVASGQVEEKAQEVYVSGMAITATLQSCVSMYEHEMSVQDGTSLRQRVAAYVETSSDDDPVFMEQLQVVVNSIGRPSVDPHGEGDSRRQFPNLDELMDGVFSSRWDFVEAARRELGVFESDAVSPSPPSGPTS